MEYNRFVKTHKKQMKDMEELIIQLKSKQSTLKQQLRIIKQSEKYQNDQFEIISHKIYEAINNNLNKNYHDKKTTSRSLY
jgi:uncharacterized protein YkuJ